MKEKSEKILRRIRQLLAMAADTSSPNEATIASRRARALMDEYQIRELDLKTTNDADFGTARTLWESSYHGMLGIAMAWLNDVNVKQLDGDGFLEVPHLLFQGYLVDAVTAKELWLYLVAQCEKQSKSIRGKKDSFKRGFAAGVQKHVKEILKDREQLKCTNGKSLVLSKRNIITSKFGIMQTSQARSKRNANYTAGLNAGYKTGLSRQINNPTNKYLR